MTTRRHGLINARIPDIEWETPQSNARARDEPLAVELFFCHREAQLLGETWRWDCTQHHPHSALGMKAPARFARDGASTPKTADRSHPRRSPQEPQNAAGRARSKRRTPNRADHVPGARPPAPSSSLARRSHRGVRARLDGLLLDAHRLPRPP